MIQTHISLIITNAYLTFPSKGYILIVKSKVKKQEQTIIIIWIWGNSTKTKSVEIIILLKCYKGKNKANQY